MHRRTTRRDFLKHTTLAGVGYWATGGVARAQRQSANDKLNIAIIGAGGQGGGNLRRLADLGENIVALCDVDEERAAASYQRFPAAEKFHDFRVLLEKRKDIDAVVVSTPDHVHAPAGVMAMKLGKHLYCEKPLTHSVYEARVMRETAAKYKVATQMGNGGTASSGLRRAVEYIRAGVIGPVREVHVWTNRPIWPQGMDRPTEAMPIPKTLHWDLWLGPAPERPYHKAYAPFAWRGWWDFGTGALGDMACHTANLPFLALELGHPISVEAKVSAIHPESAPKWSTITYQFPARGSLPPVTLTWYDGKRPTNRGEEVPNLPPANLVQGLRPGSGSLLLGEKGTLFSPGDNGGSFYLSFNDKFTGFKAPEPTLPRSPGHHQEWVRACKGGPPALSNFEYAGRLTEMVLLGNVACRVGQKIDWDGPNLRATNCPEAEPYVRRDYRKGWSL
jgi:predicted dehydrogenase